MKYKLLGLAAAALLLLTAAAFTYYRAPEEHIRVHQHLSARRDTGCGCGGTELCSHLPLVIIDTRGQEIPGALTGTMDSFVQPVYTKAADGNPAIISEVRVIDNQDRNNHPSDEPAFTTRSELRIRGHSSRRFPKHPYLLKFVDGEGMDRDIPVMGMAAHHEWALHSPLVDQSLVRNYMMYNLAGEFMRWSPNCRYCEVIVDGSYEGLYLMVETVAAGEDCRLNLKVSAKNAEGSGYLLRIDRPTEADLESIRDIYSFAERINRVFQDVAIRYPGKNKLTEELKRDIELHYASFEKALYSYDYDTGQYAYWNWIDVDNFADYYVIEELSLNHDMGAFSTYLYKEAEEPFRLAVWDFDNSWGNAWDTVILPEEFILNERAWYLMLFKDEAFVQRVLERYRELRKTWLSEEYLLNYIDETIDYLGPAVWRDRSRWTAELVSFDTLGDGETLRTYEESVDALKDIIIQRGGYLDEEIHAIQQYCHPSRNKKYNH